MHFLGFEFTVSEGSVEALLLELRKTNIQGVYINSPGGKFEFFSRLGPAIQQRGILTLAGDVRSAAIILFLLGHTRHAYPNATFFFHEVRTLVGQNREITIAELEEAVDYEKYMLKRGDQDVLAAWYANMQAAQTWFLQFLAAKTGVPTGTFLNLMRSQAVLTAQDAVRYGIVHRIVDYGEY